MRGVIIFAALIGVLLSLCMASTAHAQDVTSNPMVTALAKQGNEWWQGYGKSPCPAAKVHVTLADFNGEGYAEPGSCDVTLNRRLWREAQGWPLDGYLIAMRIDLCKVMFHELGHTASVLHFNNGWLMDGRGLDHMSTPARCVKWANNRRTT